MSGNTVWCWIFFLSNVIGFFIEKKERRGFGMALCGFLAAAFLVLAITGMLSDYHK